MHVLCRLCDNAFRVPTLPTCAQCMQDLLHCLDDFFPLLQTVWNVLFVLHRAVKIICFQLLSNLVTSQLRRVSLSRLHNMLVRTLVSYFRRESGETHLLSKLQYIPAVVSTATTTTVISNWNVATKQFVLWLATHHSSLLPGTTDCNVCRGSLLKFYLILVSLLFVRRMDRR